MRVLIDMNLSPSWMEALATRGVEAIHWTALAIRARPITK
jgi:predicted nuclease of predicted toxin-antitoxin system